MKQRTLPLMIALLILLAGCGPSPAPTLTPSEVAGEAALKMQSVSSFHFLIVVTGKAAYLDAAKTTALKQAEGDLVKPDRVRAIAKVSTLGMSSEIGIIGIGEVQYATNPLNQQWEEVPPQARWSLDLASLFDEEQGIPAILLGSSWSLGSGEGDVYVLTARMPYQQLRALSFGLITSGEVQVEFRIGRDTLQVRRIQIVEVQSDAEKPTTWTIDLSAFDKPVDIQPPPK